MVILPFMKHGDLHAFLLASRIGENPFVSVSGGGGQEELGGKRDRTWEEEACWAGLKELMGREGSESDYI